MNSGRRTRVALASVGLGRVQRGFERWAGDLANIFAKHPDVELTTYGSKRTGVPLEAVPGGLKPVTDLLRRLPLARVAGTEEYKRDCIAFALCLLPDLFRFRYDVVHVVDPPLAVALAQLRRVVRYPGKLLFTDGCSVPPEYVPKVDHLHHVGHKAFQEAIRSGFPRTRMTFIPSGLHTGKFAAPAERDELRRRFGIGQETFVILMVSALKRDHKRVDHAIHEVQRLEGDILLWLDGNPEDDEILSLAAKMGSRCRVTHVASEEVPSLYKTADVMVHTALSEAFGLTLAEAMCSGLTVLAHREPHFEWLVQDPDCLVDMTVDGALATRLSELIAKRGATISNAHRRAADVRDRFEWTVLRSEYASMYHRVAATGVAENGAAAPGPDSHLARNV